MRSQFDAWELSPGTLSLDGAGASPLIMQVCAPAQPYRSRLAGDRHAFTSPALDQPNQENSSDFHFPLAGVSQVKHDGADLAIGRALAHHRRPRSDQGALGSTPARPAPPTILPLALHLLQLILSSRRAQVGTVGGASNVFFDAGDQGEPPHPQEGSLAACWSCCIRQWDRPSRFFCLYGHVWACPSFFVCREERVVRTIAPRLGGPWGGVGPWEPFWRVPDAQGTRRKPYNSRQLVADPAS